MEKSLSQKFIRSIFWSTLKNWGRSGLTFVIFIFLARLLTPAEIGIASIAALVLVAISVIYDFGFSDALIQRRNLAPEDVNLPFFASTAASILIATGATFYAPVIATWFKSDGVAPMIAVLAWTGPLTTIATFQEVMYKRHLDFRKLALRIFISNSIAGVVAISCAYLGAGAWSLIIQSYVAIAVSLVWLWWKPLWRPSWTIRPKSFVELFQFGSNVIIVRIVDLLAMRAVDMIITVKFGVALLGVYTVGAKLNQTLMMLFQTVLNDVSLSFLSKISADRARVAGIYRQAIVLAAYTAAPIFVLMAATADYWTLLVLGDGWSDVPGVAKLLFLLGSVQCVQFLNAPYLSAMGKPSLAAIATVVKSASVVLVLLMAPYETMHGVVSYFVVAQLVGTPFSFHFVHRTLAIPIATTVADMSPAYIGSLAAFGAVTVAVPYLAGLHPLLGLACGTALFVPIYAGIAMLLGRRQIENAVAFVRNRVKPRAS